MSAVRETAVRFSKQVEGASPADTTQRMRRCRLERRWLGDQIRKSAPRLTRIVRMKTPLSFVSRARPTGFHTFLRSTSSRYRLRPGSAVADLAPDDRLQPASRPSARTAA